MCLSLQLVVGWNVCLAPRPNFGECDDQPCNNTNNNNNRTMRRRFFISQVLQVELMFSKLASLETDNSNASKKATNGAGGGAQEGGAVEEEEQEEKGSEEEGELTLKPVAVQRFEASLSGGHWGLHAYVPVTFSGVHFVRVDCMVRVYGVVARGVPVLTTVLRRVVQ